ncbi:hypothetical protein [Sphingomonas cavernae]|nr:hypothetical protein [Sphingomonas cavernae]
MRRRTAGASEFVHQQYMLKQIIPLFASFSTLGVTLFLYVSGI